MALPTTQCLPCPREAASPAAKANVIRAAPQCLGIAKQLFLGRRHPVISFPKQSGFGWLTGDFYELQRSHFLLLLPRPLQVGDYMFPDGTHRPYVLFLCDDSKLWALSFSPHALSSFRERIKGHLARVRKGMSKRPWVGAGLQ